MVNGILYRVTRIRSVLVMPEESKAACNDQNAESIV